MSERGPLSIGAIENRLRDAINRQNELTSGYLDVIEAAGRAETLFKTRFAKERFNARVLGVVNGVKISGDAADDIATIETEDERFEMEATAAKRDAHRQALLSIREEIGALQSLNSNYRTVTGGS
jgi:hypothetical protein